MDKELRKRLDEGLRIARNMPPPERPLERRTYFTGGSDYAKFAEHSEKHGCIWH
jgi:hypothetical protein